MLHAKKTHLSNVRGDGANAFILQCWWSVASSGFVARRGKDGN